MFEGPASGQKKPRELRRRVVLPARLRCGSGWSDACILNVSSRGMMVRWNRATQGATVELWHGQTIIVARVVWTSEGRAGLCADDPVPVDYIATVAQVPFEAPAQWQGRERRQLPRSHDRTRERARRIEFVGVAAFAVLLAAGVYPMIRSAFSRPLTAIEVALASNPR